MTQSIKIGSLWRRTRKSDGSVFWAGESNGIPGVFFLHKILEPKERGPVFDLFFKFGVDPKPEAHPAGRGAGSGAEPRPVDDYGDEIPF